MTSITDHINAAARAETEQHKKAEDVKRAVERLWKQVDDLNVALANRRLPMGVTVVEDHMAASGDDVAIQMMLRSDTGYRVGGSLKILAKLSFSAAEGTVTVTRNPKLDERPLSPYHPPFMLRPEYEEKYGRRITMPKEPQTYALPDIDRLQADLGQLLIEAEPEFKRIAEEPRPNRPYLTTGAPRQG